MKLRSLWLPLVTAVALIVGVLGAGATTVTAAAVTSNTTTARTATQGTVTTLKRVSPLNAQGHLRARYTVTSTRRGYCWTASFMNGRLYRCMSGNYIFDPCWKVTGRKAVICITVPWSTKVTRLRLTRRLPAKGTYGPGIWGLRLGGGVGVNCLVSTGASGSVGNHPISYFCSRGWVLLGNGPDRSRPLWTMLTAKRVAGVYELRGRKPLPIGWKAVVR